MEYALLQKFINQKTTEYKAIEPTRKGTSRGEKVGFMLPKYHAALLCLTNTKLKDIAKALDMSPELLYVWRTEEPFVKLVADLESEIVSLFWDTAKDFIRRLEDNYDDGITGNPRFAKEFGNVTIFSFDVKMRIIKEAPTGIPQTTINAILSFLFNPKSKDVKEKRIREAFEAYCYEARLDANRRCREIVEKSSINTDEKKYVLYYLDTIGRNIKPE